MELCSSSCKVGITKVAHETLRMAQMEDPAERLSEDVCGIDDAGDMTQLDITIFAPILDGKMLNVNVA